MRSSLQPAPDRVLAAFGSGEAAPGWHGQHWRGLVVFCSGASWDGVQLTGKSMAAKLTRYAPVLYVDPPTSLLRARRFAQAAPGRSRLRWLGPNLARLTPVVPPGVTRPVLREAGRLFARAALGRAVAQLGGDVQAVVVEHLEDLLGACGESTRVFYGTDDYVAGADLMGMSHDWSRRAEERQLRRATLVVGASPALVDRWAPRAADIALVRNGCHVDHYADADLLPTPPGLPPRSTVAGFVGHLSDRIDLAYLEAVADSDIGLLLAGPISPAFRTPRLQQLLARPNVRYVGCRTFEELPAYLGACDVGLVPYADSAFNRASFPLKTVEYLAAGLPVVATDLPASRSLAANHVRIAATAEEFAARVLEAAFGARDRAQMLARRAYAAEHSWDIRAGEFARLLGIDGPAARATASHRDRDAK